MHQPTQKEKQEARLSFQILFQRAKIINLDMDFLNDTELSVLFHAADAVLLPYKVCSGSGVMFDALAHGLPFIASDLEFFREFGSMGLDIAKKAC